MKRLRWLQTIQVFKYSTVLLAIFLIMALFVLRELGAAIFVYIGIFIVYYTLTIEEFIVRFRISTRVRLTHVLILIWIVFLVSTRTTSNGGPPDDIFLRDYFAYILVPPWVYVIALANVRPEGDGKSTRDYAQFEPFDPYPSELKALKDDAGFDRFRHNKIRWVVIIWLLHLFLLHFILQIEIQ